MAYTERLDIPRTRSRDSCRFIVGVCTGINFHSRNARAINREGAKKNKYGEAVDGLSVSLINSFKPSAKG